MCPVVYREEKSGSHKLKLQHFTSPVDEEWIKVAEENDVKNLLLYTYPVNEEEWIKGLTFPPTVFEIIE